MKEIGELKELVDEGVDEGDEGLSQQMSGGFWLHRLSFLDDKDREHSGTYRNKRHTDILLPMVSLS